MSNVVAPANALNGGILLYHQVYLQLRAEILDGSWVGRDDFPGEIDVAGRFGVSVVTSRKALNRLSEEGLIERARGRRTRVVRAPEARRLDAPPDIFGMTNGRRRAFEYVLLNNGIGVAPAEACEAFQRPPGSELWLCSRLRSFQGQPHSVTLNGQLPTVGLKHTTDELERFPMWHLMRKRGMKYARMKRKIVAALAPPKVSSRLGLMINEPVLVYTFSQHDDKDEVVQWVRIWVRHDEPGLEEVFDYNAGTWSMNSTM